jgi:hypothetical protein
MHASKSTQAAQAWLSAGLGEFAADVANRAGNGKSSRISHLASRDRTKRVPAHIRRGALAVAIGKTSKPALVSVMTNKTALASTSRRHAVNAAADAADGPKLASRAH